MCVSGKKRICVVAASPLTVRALLWEQVGLLSKHFDVTVLANWGKEGPPPLGSHGSVRFVSLPIERAVSPARDAWALARLVAFFRAERFDAVHSVTPKAGLLAMTAARVCGIPVRTHVFTGQVWATRRGLGRFVLKNVDWFFARQATGVLVDSLSQREYLIAHGVVGAHQCKVLESGSLCGADTHRFVPNLQARREVRGELGIDQDAPMLLFVGRLNYDKGVLDLVDAFARQPGSLEPVLVFVGPDEAGMMGKIRQRAGKAVDRVLFVDYTRQPERYMAAADVLCLPSYREGFPTVVLEAAACEVPVLGSRVYGVTDALVDGVTGLLHEPRDVADLAVKMRRLLVDPCQRKVMGEMGRKRVVDSFSKERVNGAMLEWYQDVVG